MGNFKQNNRSGGRGKSRDFGGRNSGRPSMYRVTCSDCGKDCEVPFKPTGDKPVFCSDCFRNKGKLESRGFSGRKSGRFDSSEKRMHKAICDKCGKDCQVPFRPTGGKPIYCSECFGHGDKGRSNNQENKQFELINTKLDKILKVLGSTEVDKKKETIEKMVIVKPKKIRKIKDKKTVSPKKKKAVVAKSKKISKSKVATKKAKAKKKK